MEPRPPVHFTPQSETEKRIMEILESTAGLRRQQEEKQDNDKDPPSKPGTPVKSMQKETKTADTGAVHDVTVPSTTASGIGGKPVLPVTSSKNIEQSQHQPIATKPPVTVQAAGSNLNLPSSAELSRESEDSQDSEPILPMNVMIHQQSMPRRASMQQMFGGTVPPQSSVSKSEVQQPLDMPHSEDTARSTSSSPRVPPSSNSPRIPTPHSVEMSRSTTGSPRIQQPQDGSRSASSSPRIPQSPNQWHPPDLYRQGVGQRYPHPPEGYRSGSNSPRVSDPQTQKMVNSPRIPSVPSPKDIQRTVPSPRTMVHPHMDPQRPGSANSDTSRTGSPRISSTQSPAVLSPYSGDHQGQQQGGPSGGVVGPQQSHYLPRTLPHQIPSRGKSPGRASPRQSQPSPISDPQMVGMCHQIPSQFQGRKSPGQAVPPNMGRGMPHYPPSSLPVSFQSQNMPQRPGMIPHSIPNRFQQPPPNFPATRPTHLGMEMSSRPTQMGMEMSQRPPQLGMEMSSRQAQTGMEMSARPPQLGMEMSARPAQPGMEMSPRPTQLGMEMSPRPTQLGMEMLARPAQQGMEMQSRPVLVGMEQPPRPTQFGADQQSKPAQFAADQQRTLAQRYKYPYPQSVTSSLAESTLAQLPRFTAKVTSTGDSSSVQTTPITTSGNISSTTVLASKTGQTSLNPSEPVIPRSNPEKTGIYQSEPALPTHQSMNMLPHSMQNNTPHSLQTSQLPQSHMINTSKSEPVSHAVTAQSQLSSISTAYSTQGIITQASSHYSSVSTNIQPSLQSSSISKQSEGQSFNEGLHSIGGVLSSQNVSRSIHESSSSTNSIQGTSASTTQKENVSQIPSESSMQMVNVGQTSQTVSQTLSSVTIATTESTNQKSSSSNDSNAASESSSQTPQ